MRPLYILTGGMPAAVATWARGRSMLECTEVHHRLVATFREDFQKYGGRVPAERLRRVEGAIPRFLGQKFVFSRIEGEDRARELKAALDLLLRAGVCTRVSATDATGTPLGAEIREREFKVVFLDTGLVSAALGLSFEDVASLEDLARVDRGAIFEQAVGQMLRGAEPRFKEPRLYYWSRARSGASSEIDYVAQHGPSILPIEVKAGRTGTLESLHLFMAERELPRAVRFNADRPSLTSVDVRTTTGRPARYQLLSLPFYLGGRLHRLVSDAASRARGHARGPTGA